MEDAERGVLEEVRQFDQLAVEAQVGLVGAVPAHGLPVGHVRNRSGQVVADERPDRLQDILGHRDDVGLLDEAHLDVELGELGLAVGAVVLVPVAAGDLVVALHPRDHEQLLEQLGALGQGVPGTGRQSCGYEEVAGALGGGSGEGRGLDLHEVVGVQHPARSLVDLGAQANGALHLRAAQIQVAVLQTRLLTDLARIFGVIRDLEGQGGRGTEDLDVGDDDLDLTRGQVRVVIALRAGSHPPGHRQNVLGAQVVSDLLTDDDLSDARRVAQIDEGDAPVIAATIHPSGEGDDLADIGGAQGACGAGSQHGAGFLPYGAGH